MIFHHGADFEVGGLNLLIDLLAHTKTEGPLFPAAVVAIAMSSVLEKI
jgi:hypothetical protein